MAHVHSTTGRQRVNSVRLAPALVSHFIQRCRTMSYQDLLSPWVIYRLLPSLQRRAIARFRRRNEAEAYLGVIQRMLPQIQFEIVFELSEVEEPIAAVPLPPANSPLDRIKSSETAPMID